MHARNPVPLLRFTALIEGVSFLVLLGVAMPLKYFAGMPGAVKAVGWVHGVLFVVFCVALAQTMRVARWPVGRGAMVFAAALLPFGPFLVDRRMKRYGEEFERRPEARERTPTP
jgi:integral membrane protein